MSLLEAMGAITFQVVFGAAMMLIGWIMRGDKHDT